jgi:NTE family protein
MSAQAVLERTMNGKRIAIACQGGGSQCAFVAGALGTLLADGVQHRSRIVGLSGTSGGAITAALGWVGLLEEARGGGMPIQDRIIGCWKDLSAQTPQEILLDRFSLMTLRLTERGLLPSFASSPASAQVQLLSRAVSRLIGRPEFTDLGALLAKHIPFAKLPTLVDPDSPALLVGAADVLEGTFKVFSSKQDEITLESLLASAAIPTLFPAVWVNGHAYWDGIFSSNPPILDFLRKPQMGEGTFPNEIWIIQVNRVRRDTVPELPSDILDRRNHLSGNLSLQHELQVVDIFNVLSARGGLTDELRAHFGVGASDTITVRFIRMSDELQRNLDYPSKLSREPGHIDTLIADGVAQARAFLAELEAGVAPPEPSAAQAVLQDSPLH